MFQQHFQRVISWDSPGWMPYSLGSEALDLAQMVKDIRKQLKSTYFIIPNNFCFKNISKKSFPGTPWGQWLTHGCPMLWTSPRWSWTSYTTKINLFYNTQQLWFQQHCQKDIPWDTPGSMPYSWFSEALDFAHMVMDIGNQLLISNHFHNTQQILFQQHCL